MLVIICNSVIYGFFFPSLALCQGEESTQPFEHKQPDEIFSLLAEVRGLRKIVTERERYVQQKENEELKKMLEEFKQMNIQMRHLLRGKESKYQLASLKISTMCFNKRFGFFNT